MIPESLGTMAAYISLNTTRLEAGMRVAEARLTRFGNRLRTWGTTMSLYISAPIGLAFGLGIRSLLQFEDAMTKSTSIMVGLTDDLREAMERQARTLSENGVQAANELAKSYFYLASAGMDAEASMAALPVVQKFATAGAFDMAVATDLLTDAQKAMGLASKDAQKNMENLVRVADVLTQANVMDNATVQQFAESMTNDASVAARQFGAELETVVSALAAYAGVGIKGAKAGSEMGRAFRLLSKAYMENGQVFEKYGIRMINQATGEYRNFIDIIHDIEMAFKDLTGPQRAVALEQLGFQARTQRAILPLIGLSTQMKEYERVLLEAGGTMQEVYDRQMKSPLARLKQLKNQLVSLGMDISKIVLPMLEKMGDFVRNLIDRWKGLSKAQQENISKILAITALIGPMALAFGGLVKVLGSLVVVIRRTAIAFSFLLAHPIVALIAAIVVVVGAAAYRIYKFSKAISDSTSKLNKSAQAAKQKIRKDEELAQKLMDLSSSQNLTNEEMDWAQTVIGRLEDRYGDLGIKVDEAARSIEGAADAQQRLNRILDERRIRDLRQELEQEQRTYHEMQKSYERTLRGIASHPGVGHFIMAEITGRTPRIPLTLRIWEAANREEQKKLDEQLDKVAKISDKISELEASFTRVGKKELPNIIPPGGSGEGGLDEAEDAIEKINSWEDRLHQERLMHIQNEYDREMRLLDMQFAKELENVKGVAEAEELVRKTWWLASKRRHQELLDQAAKEAERRAWEIQSWEDRYRRQEAMLIEDRWKREIKLMNLRYDAELQRAKGNDRVVDLIQRTRAAEYSRILRDQAKELLEGTRARTDTGQSFADLVERGTVEAYHATIRREDNYAKTTADSSKATAKNTNKIADSIDRQNELLEKMSSQSPEVIDLGLGM